MLPEHTKPMSAFGMPESAIAWWITGTMISTSLCSVSFATADAAYETTATSLITLAPLRSAGELRAHPYRSSVAPGLLRSRRGCTRLQRSQVVLVEVVV